MVLRGNSQACSADVHSMCDGDWNDCACSCHEWNCWYCGDRFDPEVMEDNLCPQCYAKSQRDER